ncbi:uncharacterized protein LOC111403603 isoform X2 [Olea europaea var. sylvestris]|uniref:uncharacterized protein LOC111403603 isoform X2 n=1 Tax=Olea europaea var. sylvestris TaxID=158386 RepID=UPI000C1CCF10|nr:uncharacterized protein LOC111403603 isoform X2 [Olea europaea var. sylvestris]
MDIVELWVIFGPGVAGAVFGAGWWFWVDAVVCSSVKVSFVHYLPGIFASLAALMFNSVKKDDVIDQYSPYDEGEWSFGWPIDTRCSGEDWPFSMDRSCWCFSMCVCINKWSDVLDL